MDLFRSRRFADTLSNSFFYESVDHVFLIHVKWQPNHGDPIVDRLKYAIAASVSEEEHGLWVRHDCLLGQNFPDHYVARQVRGDLMQLHDDTLLELRKSLDEPAFEVRRDVGRHICHAHGEHHDAVLGSVHEVLYVFWKWSQFLLDRGAQDVDVGRQPRHGHLKDTVRVDQTPADVGDHLSTRWTVGNELRDDPIGHCNKKRHVTNTVYFCHEIELIPFTTAHKKMYERVLRLQLELL